MEVTRNNSAGRVQYIAAILYTCLSYTQQIVGLKLLTFFLHFFVILHFFRREYFLDFWNNGSTIELLEPDGWLFHFF